MRRILGIDVGGTKIASVLIDSDKDYRVLTKKNLDTGAADGKSRVLGRIYESIDSILEEQNISGSDLSGIGIALPGPVDFRTGLSFECFNLKGWLNVEIKKIIEERYGTFVYVDNDAQAATIGEAVFGTGKMFKHFIYISISTGIGCGIIIDGKLYKGADGAAGELSHILFPDKTSLCTQASGKALQDLFAVSAKDLKEKCENGDEAALKAYDHFLHYLGIGISNAVTLLNPEAVIIGGGLSSMGDFLLIPLEQRVRENAFSVSGENVKLVKAERNIDAGVLGIAYLVEKILQEADKP